MNSKSIQRHSYTTTGDKVLREVWRIKDALSASYGHDLNRLFSEARENQKKSNDKKNISVKKQKMGRRA